MYASTLEAVPIARAHATTEDRLDQRSIDGLLERRRFDRREVTAQPLVAALHRLTLIQVETKRPHVHEPGDAVDTGGGVARIVLVARQVRGIDDG